MGQKASRSIAGRLEKGMQKYRGEMEKDIYRNIQEKQQRATKAGFTDPNAMDAGFTRGTSTPIRQDVQQEAFLKSQQSQNENQEMPDDLIKFLQDMGPVERKPAKGPRLRKHELEAIAENEEQQRQSLDDGRQVRDMPIMEDVDRFTTSRTTNFSRRLEEEEKFPGLTGRQLFRLLQADDTTKQTTVESLLKQCNTTNEDERNEYLNILDNSLKYLRIPVILKDTDDSYVGVPQDDVNDMKKLKLREVPDTEVRLVLSIRDPKEKKQIGGE